MFLYMSNANEGTYENVNKGEFFTQFLVSFCYFAKKWSKAIHFIYKYWNIVKFVVA